MSAPRLQGLALAACLLLGSPCAWAPAPAGEAKSVVSAASAPRDPGFDKVRARLGLRARSLTEAELDALAETLILASRAHDLSPELVLAVIQVESAFNPHAMSQVGAVGLMQLMPPTGAETARRLGIPWRGVQTLFDPQINVRLGVAYLRQLVDRYASVRVALAAYNWGPGRIDSRLRRGTPLPARYPALVLAAYSARTDS